MSEPLLSAVVCTHDRADLLSGCLQSLLRQVVPAGSVELVVVDDGSTDGTREVIERLRRAPQPMELVYRRQEWSGLNAARNAGIAAARGEILLFVDDDELAPPGYLDKLLARFARDTDVDGIGGPCRDMGTARLRTCARCSLGDARVRVSADGTADRLLGGNMAVRRRVFDQVGPFDATLSGRGDDNEWFHRARGHRFLYDAELWLHHRRDWLDLRTLWRTGFVQGKSIPAARAKLGQRYRPRASRLLRCLGHAVRHRCSNGLARAAQELGALLAAVGLARSVAEATQAAHPNGGGAGPKDGGGAVD